MVFEDARTDGTSVDGLRITIGTDAEIDTLLSALQEAVAVVRA